MSQSTPNTQFIQNLSMRRTMIPNIILRGQTADQCDKITVCKKKSRSEITKKFQATTHIVPKASMGSPLKNIQRRNGEEDSKGACHAKIDKGGFINHTNKHNGGSQTPERLLSDFDPTPGTKVQEKIDFFFMPYKLDYSVAKSMKFKTNMRQDNYLMYQNLHEISNDPYITKEDRHYAKECISALNRQEFLHQNNWKKIQLLLLDKDRRPLLNIMKQKNKMDKIYDKTYLKEFKQKLKRKKQCARRNQIIDIKDTACHHQHGNEGGLATQLIGK